MNPEENQIPQATPVVAPVSPTEQTPVAQPVMPVVPVDPPAPKAPKSNKKIFMIFGVILFLLILVGAGVFAFTQTQEPAEPAYGEPSPFEEAMTEDESSNWQVFTDKNLGFSIKYPSDFELSKKDFNTKGDSISITKWGPTQAADSEFFDGISITIAKVDLEGKTLSGYALEALEASKENADVLGGLTEVEINGIKGRTYTVRGLGTHKNIFLPLGGASALWIIDSTVDPENMGYSRTVDGILSTLEILDSIGDWKSYTNTAYNYSFSYPLDFVIQGYDADAGGAVYPQTNNILIYALGNLEYVDRVIDIQHFDLLIAPTPTSDWKSSSASVGQKEATKYTSVSSQVKFDIYHVPYVSGGLEIMVNKSASSDSVNQILSTFEFTN